METTNELLFLSLSLYCIHICMYYMNTDQLSQTLRHAKLNFKTIPTCKNKSLQASAETSLIYIEWRKKKMFILLNEVPFKYNVLRVFISQKIIPDGLAILLARLEIVWKLLCCYCTAVSCL